MASCGHGYESPNNCSACRAIKLRGFSAGQNRRRRGKAQKEQFEDYLQGFRDIKMIAVTIKKYPNTITLYNTSILMIASPELKMTTNVLK